MDYHTTTLSPELRESSPDSHEVSRPLDKLHASTRQLIRAQSRDEIGEIVVDAAYEILGFPGTGIRFYDPESESLVSVSFDGESADDVELRPDFDVDGSPHGDAFRMGETVVYDVAKTDDPFGLDAFERTMYVPISDHGVLSFGRTDSGGFSRTDVQYAEILAANTAVALDHLERESWLRERREELERKNERLQQFASVVSHDMRGPINAAQGYLEFAEEQGDEKFFRRVDDALDRLQRFTNNLLTLAQDSSTVGQLGYVDLSEVTREAWRSVETKDATLSGPENVGIEADRESLQRLLENLFRNAVNHAGSDVGVSVGLFPDGLYVEDDGPGIPEHERDSVFEEGYSASPDGTGLGLPIVEDISEAHGWEVSLLESTTGGTRFEITGVEEV